MNKKAIRANFRNQVFCRDKYTCVVCSKVGIESSLNAHHITDRSLMPNGGYVKENGITVCEKPCHMIVESYHATGVSVDGFSPDELYKIIGSSKELALDKSKRIK